jgi:hypothetical protein
VLDDVTHRDRIKAAGWQAAILDRAVADPNTTRPSRPDRKLVHILPLRFPSNARENFERETIAATDVQQELSTMWRRQMTRHQAQLEAELRVQTHQ